MLSPCATLILHAALIAAWMATARCKTRAKKIVSSLQNWACAMLMNSAALAAVDKAPASIQVSAILTALIALWRTTSGSSLSSTCYYPSLASSQLSFWPFTATDHEQGNKSLMKHSRSILNAQTCLHLRYHRDLSRIQKKIPLTTERGRIEKAISDYLISGTASRNANTSLDLIDSYFPFKIKI